MRILVTGGTGLVGSALQKITQMSQDDWIFISSRDVDLTDRKATLAFFEKVKPEYVIHLAAHVGGLYRNMREPARFWLANSRINNNVLEASMEVGVIKVLSCLSTCVFPDGLTTLTETDLHLGPPHPSNAAYAYSKRMVDILGRALNQEKKTRFISVIPTNLYGEHDNFNPETGHDIPGLIARMHACVQEKKPFSIWGTGKPLRQFVHAQDFARILTWMIFHYEDEESLIVAPDREVSILNVTEIIAKKLGYTGLLHSTPEKADGQYCKTAQNLKMKHVIPPEYQPIISLEDGIAKTVESYIKLISLHGKLETDQTTK